jgi:glucose-6-phosphate 1-epimerase
MITVKKLENGFEYLEVHNDASHAKIALQGAHLFSCRCQGKELLWVSEASEFVRGKAIRGGVPICWPAFGNNNPALLQHGFARTAMWELERCQELDERTTQVSLRLCDMQEYLGMWDYKCEVRLIFTLGETLEMELVTTNNDTRSFELTQALHTYFSVSNIEKIAIYGLVHKPCFDALTEITDMPSEPIRFRGEYDRVFQEVEGAIELRDEEGSITIQNEGSRSVVVWNPWIEKGSRMSGMRPDDYRRFVCIESANAYGDKRVLEAGATHRLKAVISFS